MISLGLFHDWDGDGDPVALSAHGDGYVAFEVIALGDIFESVRDGLAKQCHILRMQLEAASINGSASARPRRLPVRRRKGKA